MVKFKIILEYRPDIGHMELADAEEKSAPMDLVLWGWDHFSQLPIYAEEGFPKLEDKFDNHHNHKRKVAFESELAFAVLQNPGLFQTTFQKLGFAMQKYLNSHLSEEQKVIAGGHFREYLYSDKGIFGTLGPQQDAINYPDKDIYDFALKGLRNWTAVEQLVNAHVGVLAVYRQVLNCENDADYQHWYQLLRASDLFTIRGRDKNDELETKLVDTAGIHQDTSEQQLTVQPHKRALDKTERDHINVSDFAFDAYKREIPFVCGPSGTAVECLVGVKMLGDAVLTSEEMREYVFCCMAYLVAAGTHSLHEIYVIAEKIGVPYEIGRYEAVIPEVFKKTEDYINLTRKYSDIIKLDPVIAEEKLRGDPVYILTTENTQSRASSHVSDQGSMASGVSTTQGSPTTSTNSRLTMTPSPLTFTNETPNVLRPTFTNNNSSQLAKKRGFKKPMKLELFSNKNNNTEPSNDEKTVLARKK